MAYENQKSRTRHAFKTIALLLWPLVLMLAAGIVAGIIFSDGTTVYWLGAVFVAVLLFITAGYAVFIVRNVMNFDRDELEQKKFTQSYDCLGIFMLLTIGACIACMAVAGTVGSNYGRHDKNETITADDDHVHVEENRTVAAVLAVISGMTMILMIRIICTHGEVKVSIPAAQTAPAPSQPPPNNNGTAAPPPAATKTAAKPNNEEEIKLLTNQNNFLKEQYRLQEEQLQQLRTMTGQLQRLTAGPSAPPQPPPDYTTATNLHRPGNGFMAGPRPGKH